jgi:hypothetical protein
MMINCDKFNAILEENLVVVAEERIFSVVGNSPVPVPFQFFYYYYELRSNGFLCGRNFALY